MSDISNLQRDYLAEIYQACIIENYSNDEMISSADLAFRLGNSQSSVNRILERLRTAELINHERYVGVRLTHQGQYLAAHIMQKQAIIEAFLWHVMGLDWHLLYDEAKQMRHGVNAKLLGRMLQLAGHPATSPFGEPIAPSPPLDDDNLLSYAEVKRDYVIRRVLTRQSDRLQYLGALGLQPGCTIYLIHKSPFNGPLQIKLGREYRILGHELAQMLTITPPD